MCCNSWFHKNMNDYLSCCIAAILINMMLSHPVTKHSLSVLYSKLSPMFHDSCANDTCDVVSEESSCIILIRAALFISPLYWHKSKAVDKSGVRKNVWSGWKMVSFYKPKAFYGPQKMILFCTPFPPPIYSTLSCDVAGSLCNLFVI